MQPLCYSCGNENEHQLIKREGEMLEWWCEPCIVYHLATFTFTAQWARRIFSRFVMREFRKLPWRKRLYHWIGASKTMKEQADRLLSPDCNERWALAKWHTARFRLMYEPDCNVKLIYVEGVQIIKVLDIDKEEIVSIDDMNCDDLKRVRYAWLDESNLHTIKSKPLVADNLFQ